MEPTFQPLELTNGAKMANELLKEFLSDLNIQTLIHYPIPPHKQIAYKEFNDLNLPITERIHEEVLSLSIGPAMTDEEVLKVIEAVNRFYI